MRIGKPLCDYGYVKLGYHRRRKYNVVQMRPSLIACVFRGKSKLNNK